MGLATFIFLIFSNNLIIAIVSINRKIETIKKNEFINIILNTRLIA
jgi:hypothetical protein